MSNDNPGLCMYPDWIREDPIAAKELLASIAFKCKTRQPLNEEEQSYLADCITKILKGVKPARALYLTRPQGRPQGRRPERGADTTDTETAIFNEVQKRIDAGKPKAVAFEQVSALPQCVKAGTDRNLTPGAIEKIFDKVLKMTGQKKPSAARKRSAKTR